MNLFFRVWAHTKLLDNRWIIFESEIYEKINNCPTSLCHFCFTILLYSIYIWRVNKTVEFDSSCRWHAIRILGAKSETKPFIFGGKLLTSNKLLNNAIQTDRKIAYSLSHNAISFKIEKKNFVSWIGPRNTWYRNQQSSRICSLQLNKYPSRGNERTRVCVPLENFKFHV